MANTLPADNADAGHATVLADYDTHGSALSGLDERPETAAPLTGLAGYDDGLRHLPRHAGVLIVDSAAGSHGPELTELVRHAETILVPVLPSPIDIRAATDFIAELLDRGKVARRQAKVGVVANRVKENTLIFEELDEYLEKLKVPYLAALREAQNYIRAYQRGLGIHELPPYLAWPDWEQWDPIIEWLDSRRSRPR